MSSVVGILVLGVTAVVVGFVADWYRCQLHRVIAERDAWFERCFERGKQLNVAQDEIDGLKAIADKLPLVCGERDKARALVEQLKLDLVDRDSVIEQLRFQLQNVRSECNEAQAEMQRQLSDADTSLRASLRTSHNEIARLQQELMTVRNDLCEREGMLEEQRLQLIAAAAAQQERSKEINDLWGELRTAKYWQNNYDARIDAAMAKLRGDEE